MQRLGGTASLPMRIVAAGVAPLLRLGAISALRWLPTIARSRCYSVVERIRKDLSYTKDKKSSNGDGNYGFFLKYFFICAIPLRTERRTALLSTPSALAISR